MILKTKSVQKKKNFIIFKKKIIIKKCSLICFLANIESKWYASPKDICRRIPPELESINPIISKIARANEYKAMPLKRSETDLQMYNDIFVSPK